MKNDEKRFLIDIYNICCKSKGKTIVFGIITNDFPTPREIINSDNFYMHHKRAWYLLKKWANKGWYDYGVTLDLGWLTEKGIRKASELI